MRERSYTTLCGDIHYWVGGVEDGRTLVFLPGLTADHRLFEKQLDSFAETCRVLVWDPPGHGASWPFQLSFHLMDQAEWLDAILEREGVHAPVLVGQSMGGYVGQTYTQRYPGKLGGFVAIDSAPLQRKYVTGAELWLLKRMEPVYRFWPWKWLLSAGSRGVSVTEYGQTLMREMMLVYQGDQVRYVRLAGHGFRMLAEAMEADLPYRLDCPALLLCGEADRAGSCKRYNRAWHRDTGIPLHWLTGAGHNANCDQPQQVNELLEDFIRALPAP